MQKNKDGWAFLLKFLFALTLVISWVSCGKESPSSPDSSRAIVPTSGWVVLSVVGQHVPLNTVKELGTEWRVTFRLQYKPSTFGSFVETPQLAWDEAILYNDYIKKETWSFTGNFYKRKPDSPTMAVWAQRYFRAYLNAKGTPYEAFGNKQKGYSKLYDLNNNPVSIQALETVEGFDKQNRAVQDYLKKNGGILEIQVHDVPSVFKPVGGAHKKIERVLAFNCGVTGFANRARGWQHISIDSNVAESSWLYNFQTIESAPGLKTSGLSVVPDPTPSGNLLPEGGIW